MVDIGVSAWILGIMIFLNIIGAAFNKNILAVLGWTVALLEWARRLS